MMRHNPYNPVILPQHRLDGQHTLEGRLDCFFTAHDPCRRTEIPTLVAQYGEEGKDALMAQLEAAYKGKKKRNEYTPPEKSVHQWFAEDAGATRHLWAATTTTTTAATLCVEHALSVVAEFFVQQFSGDIETEGLAKMNQILQVACHSNVVAVSVRRAPHHDKKRKILSENSFFVTCRAATEDHLKEAHTAIHKRVLLDQRGFFVAPDAEAAQQMARNAKRHLCCHFAAQGAPSTPLVLEQSESCPLQPFKLHEKIDLKPKQSTEKKKQAEKKQEWQPVVQQPDADRRWYLGKCSHRHCMRQAPLPEQPFQAEWHTYSPSSAKAASASPCSARRRSPSHSHSDEESVGGVSDDADSVRSE